MIVGHRTALDPAALGLALTAVIRIRPSPRQLQRVAELARQSPEVVECHRITGEDCFFVKAHLRDVRHLEEVVDRFVATPFYAQAVALMLLAVALQYVAASGVAPFIYTKF